MYQNSFPKKSKEPGTKVNSLFSDVVVSDGFLICVLLTVPLSLFNLDDNVPIQIVTTLFCLGCILLWEFDILFLSRIAQKNGGIAQVGEYFRTIFLS